jgi:hypothetical protein
MIYRIRLVFDQRDPIHPMLGEKIVPLSKFSLIEQASLSIEKMAHHLVVDIRR